MIMKELKCYCPYQSSRKRDNGAIFHVFFVIWKLWNAKKVKFGNTFKKCKNVLRNKNRILEMNIFLGKTLLSHFELLKFNCKKSFYGSFIKYVHKFFWKTYIPPDTLRTYVYQGVRDVRFFRKLLPKYLMNDPLGNTIFFRWSKSSSKKKYVLISPSWPVHFK